jgi:hypothetical protein
MVESPSGGACVRHEHYLFRNDDSRRRKQHTRAKQDSVGTGRRLELCRATQHQTRYACAYADPYNVRSRAWPPKG